jgi:hypothetical protein
MRGMYLIGRVTNGNNTLLAGITLEQAAIMVGGPQHVPSQAEFDVIKANQAALMAAAGMAPQRKAASGFRRDDMNGTSGPRAGSRRGLRTRPGRLITPSARPRLPDRDPWPNRKPVPCGAFPPPLPPTRRPCAEGGVSPRSPCVRPARPPRQAWPPVPT